MTTSIGVRGLLEATVAEYHHVRSEHRRAGAEGTIRRHLHAQLGRLEAHLERLLEESVADEEAREAWRSRLHYGSPAPIEPQPPGPALLFKGRSAAGSVVEVRQRTDGDCDVIIDGARLERVAAARDLAENELPLVFRVAGQEFQEIFEAPTQALAAARAYISDPSEEPPWQHAPALAAEGLIDGTFALTPRGRRALPAGRTGP
jgi:hypothetical protein